jgi:predicted GH43/DUF377 family glycosyl hydrolase
MIDASVLVSTIVVVDEKTVGSLRSIHESFQRQTHPHRELVFVNLLDKDIGDGLQVKPSNGESPVAAGVRISSGQVCVIWTPGLWYHQEVLGIHARLTQPLLRVDLRHAMDEPIYSSSFFRRSYPALSSPLMKTREVGAVGLVERMEGNHDPKGWRLYHSGNLGDIIYSMPAMKVMGFGIFYLGPEIRLNPKPDLREVMSPKVVKNLAPLMLAQPYVKSVFYVEKMPIVNYDLNLFRNFGGLGKNLVEQSLDACCLSAGTFFNDLMPWLDVDPIVLKRSVVIHRSHRWRNQDFPWHQIVNKFRRDMVFVGTGEEYASFVADYGLIPHVPTANLLELARLIAGCHLFIGNQSCPYAIAEGLKVNTIQETYPQLANCKFKRPNAIYGQDRFVYIPELKHLPPNPRRKEKWHQRKLVHQAQEINVIETPKKFESFYTHNGVPATINGLRRSIDMASTHLFETSRMLQAIPIPPPMKRNVIQWTFGRKGRVEAWFNPSLAIWKGRKFLAYRCECIPWFRLSMVAVSELDREWNPILESTKVLDLHSKFGNYCVEDPRFFVYKENLWLTYTDAHEVGIARLNDDMTTAESFYLERPWYHTRPEKNWCFFEAEGRMFASYGIAPHKVIEVNLEDHTTKFVHETRYDYDWKRGELRGGSSPVLHDGLLWSFFHSSINIREESYGPIRQYFIGVYAFEPHPPFKPVLMSKFPLLAGEEESVQHDRPSQHSVIFPCGAIRAADGWLVTFGENDCRCRMAFFDDGIVNDLQKL